jgi:hypothetical protein
MWFLFSASFSSASDASAIRNNNRILRFLFFRQAKLAILATFVLPCHIDAGRLLPYPVRKLEEHPYDHDANPFTPRDAASAARSRAYRVDGEQKRSRERDGAVGSATPQQRDPVMTKNDIMS